MAKPYSQALRDRVIDAVKRGEMSRRASSAPLRDQPDCGDQNRLVQGLNGMARESLSRTRRPSGLKLMPHRGLSLEASRAEKSGTSRFRPCCAIAFRPSEVKADTPMP